ncbi:MAG: serine hydrolase [Planctomycetes bacterium]|nr:serine hydrolase [Planctomycetota bacterium]
MRHGAGAPRARLGADPAGDAPRGPAGTRFQRNNLNTQLLGLFLERATGRRYASLLSERIWQPIHARDAAVWLDRERGNAKVCGAVLATARDWARVGELIRNLGRVGDRQVVPAAWIERMEQPAPHRGSCGLHLWRSKGRPDAGVPPYVYLDGRAKQRVFVLRGLELVIVRTGRTREVGTTRICWR